MSSVFGNNIKISIFGESHGPAIGVTIDGIPAGKTIDMDKLMSFLARRAPGNSKYSTKRKEPDRPEFLSGIRDGVTEGSPITAIIRNMDPHSGDYSGINDIPRPGHADYAAHVKHHGFEDYRGGGHFSGRLTAPLCIAGGICRQLLEEKGIQIKGSIGEIHGNSEDPLSEIDRVLEESDSVGGIVKCTATGIPAGIGDPIFDGVENRIAACVFGIPAVKGIEFGNGFGAARLKGSENNDSFQYEDGQIRTVTNNHGGILGGITSGMPLEFRVAFKPTPSIGIVQDSVSLSKEENVKLTIRGRHDPCIVPRAVPCVEAACAIALYDMIKETE